MGILTVLGILGLYNASNAIQEYKPKEKPLSYREMVKRSYALIGKNQKEARKIVKKHLY